MPSDTWRPGWTTTHSLLQFPRKKHCWGIKPLLNHQKVYQHGIHMILQIQTYAPRWSLCFALPSKRLWDTPGHSLKHLYPMYLGGDGGKVWESHSPSTMKVVYGGCSSTGFFWIPIWSLCQINVAFHNFPCWCFSRPRCIDAVVILWIHRIRRHQRLSNAGLRKKVLPRTLNSIPL